MIRNRELRLPSDEAAGWRVTYPLGAVEAFRAMGTVAAPLLAGFGLATLTLLLTSSTVIRHASIAVTAFASGSVLFVLCLQFTASGLLYAAPPADRLAWRSPTEKSDEADVAAVVRVQRRDELLLRRYHLRARIAYDLGILGHLSGLLALVTPADWTLMRTVAFVVVAVALVLELWWIVGNWVGWPPRWLVPTYEDETA